MSKQSRSKLKEFRRARDLTQAQAAALLDVHKRTWLVWETGKGKPDDALMVKLFCLTEGWIQPNDFYDLPRLRIDRRAA